MHRPRPVLLALFSIVLAPAATAQWVGEWKLDETSGTTANDITTNANHGTLMNFGATPWISGKFGNALTFDGIDDYVELKGGKGIPVYDGKGSPYTIAFWVKAPPQHDKRVYAEGGTMGNNSPIITLGTGRNTNTTTDKFQVYIRNDIGRVVLEGYSNATVFDDTWHHVAWVEVSGDPTLYVDGVKDTSTSFRYHASYGPRSPNYGQFSMHIASIGAVLRQSACCLLLGSIDDVRVYDFAVAASDVSLMMLNVPLTPCRASIGSFGHKCNGRLTLDATGSAVFGATLTMQLTAGTPGATAMVLAGLGVHDLDLGLFGFTGCVAYPGLTNTLLIPIGMLDPSGTSVPLPVSVPTGPASITCLILAVQGIAISSGTLGMSNSLLLQVGH